jgi:hypothetical protein
MHCYEIKIIKRCGDVSLQVAEDHLSDFAAIRAAQKLCGNGDTTEVWREDVCIYSERPKQMRLVWPVRPSKALGSRPAR